MILVLEMSASGPSSRRRVGTYKGWSFKWFYLLIGQTYKTRNIHIQNENLPSV